MRTNFYIEKKNVDKKGLSPVFLYVSFDNKRIKVYTGQKVNKLLWNDKTQRLKPKIPLSESVNDFLLSIETEVNDLYLKARKDRIPITTQYMKSRLTFIRKYVIVEETEDGLKRKLVKSDLPFFDIFDEFISSHRKQWSEGTMKNFQTFKTKLQKFETEEKYILEFGSIDNSFLEKYIDWHIDNKILNTHTQKNLKLLKWFLDWSSDNEYNHNKAYQKDDWKHTIKNRLPVPGTDDNIYFLSVDEVRKIIEYQPESKTYEIVKDAFLFACFTGLRFSDVKGLKKSDIIDDKIVIIEQKGNKKREIPLNAVSAELLRKYENSPGPEALPCISNQKTNEYLKKLCSKAGIEGKAVYTNYIGKKPIKDIGNKYDIISFHTGRKTFSSLLEYFSISHLISRKLTGHTSDAMKRYQDVTPEQLANAMKKFDETFKLRIVS